MSEWGLPDWTDPHAYGQTAAWCESRWRWEFTRRREDYRADFDANSDKTFKHYVELHARLKEKGHSVGRTLEPHEPGFQADASWDQRVKYGIGLLNPRLSEQPLEDLQFRRLEQRGVFTGSGISICGVLGNAAKMQVPEGCVGLVIDLNRPIAEQLSRNRRLIERLQKERHGKKLQRRHHRELRLTYLRVIDGREAMASWTKIFEVVLKDTKGANANPAQEARGVWERARDLMFNWPD
jgi:hypothetical protein